MNITPSLREVLKKPLGVVVKDISSIPKGALLITVGDTASDTLITAGLKPKMVVYDAKTRRQNVGISDGIKSYEAEEYRVVNPAGHLEKIVFTLFNECLNDEKPSKVFVDGEEDLTALAAIMEAPEGALIVYGQPDEGLVLVEVNDKSKSKVKAIIEEMEDGS